MSFSYEQKKAILDFGETKFHNGYKEGYISGIISGILLSSITIMIFKITQKI